MFTYWRSMVAVEVVVMVNFRGHGQSEIVTFFENTQLTFTHQKTFSSFELSNVVTYCSSHIDIDQLNMVV